MNKKLKAETLKAEIMDGNALALQLKGALRAGQFAGHSAIRESTRPNQPMFCHAD